MHKTLFAAALLAVTPALAAAASPSAGPTAPAAALAQVRAHLRDVASMTADFSQTNAAGKTLTGTLTLKRPGRIRFQYQPGVPLLIVADGNALTVIDYQVRQVSRWPIGNSPLSLLLDPDRDIGGFARVVPGGAPGGLLVEGHDPKHPEFGTITLSFARSATAPAGLLLTGWTTVDAQGNRSVLLLSDQKFNMAISDDKFRWRDPRVTTRGH